MLTTSLRSILVAVGIAFCAPAQAADVIRLDAGRLIGIARQLEQSGRTADAVAAYRALSADPNVDVRAEARFRLARIAMAQRQWKNAALLLRRVLDDRPKAQPVRLALAETLAELGDEGAALRELRAAQAGGLPLDVARMVDRYSTALRARRPFGATIQVALAPDTNINVATSNDRLDTVIGDFEIDEGSQRRSGIGVSLQGAVYGRLALDSDLSLLARTNVAATLHKKKAFNDIALEVAAGPEFRAGPLRMNAEAGLMRRWYGMRTYEDRIGAKLSGSLPLTPRTVARATVGLAKSNNRLNDLQDGRIWSAEIGLEHALDSRTGIGPGLSFERSDLSDPAYSTTGWQARLIGWREFGRTTAFASIAAGRLAADERLALFPERRRDRSLRISIGATMRQAEIAGFAPQIRLSFDRNASNIEFYDHRRRRLEIGVVRAF